MESPFRKWMNSLRQPRGAEAEWPWLLRQVLTDTYLRERDVVDGYAGAVFKDRDDDFPIRATLPEKKAVKELFHTCRQGAGGAFHVGSEPFWLLGYEWPNQGGDGEKGRRADLVGLNVSGGVVVFECKLLNSDGPMTAVLEGLDYLTHLTARPNFSKIEAGFRGWVSKGGARRPVGFESVCPVLDATHEVIVLGSSDYFEQHRRSKRGGGWEAMAAIPPIRLPLSIRFAESGFNAAEARWVVG